MNKKDSNSNSSKQTSPATVSGSLPVILFLNLIFLGLVLLIYWNVIVGIVIFVISLAYRFINKYLSTAPIDDSIKKIFKNKIFLIVLCLILFFSAVSIIFFNEINRFPINASQKNISFNGIIWDEQNEPLNGVVVFLPELSIYDTTDKLGKFSFIISDTTLITVSLVAQKEGFKTYEAEGSIGNPNYNFIMIKK